MKRHTKIAIAAVVAVIGIGALGSAVVARSQGWHPGYGMHHPGMMGSMGNHGQMMYGMGDHYQMMDKAFKLHDLNGDGAVSQEEMDQFRMQRHQKFDDNKDGQLDLSEFQKLWLQSTRNRMVDRFQAFDDDGNGKVTEDEFRSSMAGMIGRHDMNGDGKVTKKELKNSISGWGHGRYYNDDDDGARREKD